MTRRTNGTAQSACLTVDGTPAEKPAPMPVLDFRSLDLPIVHEVPLELWFEAAGWPDTVPQELR